MIVLNKLLAPTNFPLFPHFQGGSFSSIAQYLFGNDEMRILMVGLDAAGKTTVLYKLKLGEAVASVPTIG